jgi:hypothetical protein
MSMLNFAWNHTDISACSTHLMSFRASSNRNVLAPMRLHTTMLIENRRDKRVAIDRMAWNTLRFGSVRFRLAWLGSSGLRSSLLSLRARLVDLHLASTVRSNGIPAQSSELGWGLHAGETGALGLSLSGLRPHCFASWFRVGDAIEWRFAACILLARDDGC